MGCNCGHVLSTAEETEKNDENSEAKQTQFRPEFKPSTTAQSRPYSINIEHATCNMENGKFCLHKAEVTFPATLHVYVFFGSSLFIHSAP
jgi:hypothetical protein